MITNGKRLTKRQAAWQGSKWITPKRRLAIYLRDGLCCCWCGAGIEDGAVLSLDHVKPHFHGGGNETGNLVTSCKRCNSSRGDRSVASFARAVAAYLNHGMTPDQIVRRVRNSQKREADTATAGEMLARRGNISTAMREVRS